MLPESGIRLETPLQLSLVQAQPLGHLLLSRRFRRSLIPQRFEGRHNLVHLPNLASEVAVLFLHRPKALESPDSLAERIVLRLGLL